MVVEMIIKPVQVSFLGWADLKHAAVRPEAQKAFSGMAALLIVDKSEVQAEAQM